MARPSFASSKSDLDDACQFLRSFTLGQNGFTQQDGAAGIERVHSLCEHLSRLFASGSNKNNVAVVTAAAKKCILAAQARLALLRNRA